MKLKNKVKFVVEQAMTAQRGSRGIALIIYNKPTRCNSGGIVFIKNYKYALHVSDALCVHLQEHYKL